MRSMSTCRLVYAAAGHAAVSAPRYLSEQPFRVLLLEGDFLDLMRSSDGKSLDADLEKFSEGKSR